MHAAPIRTARVVSLVAIALVAWPVSAQEDDPSPEQRSPLAGPEVKEQRPDRLEQGLSMAPGNGTQMGQVRRLPQRDVERLLKTLATDRVDESLRLTEEQQQSLKQLAEEHRAELRAFRAEHADEFKDLHAKSGINSDGTRVPEGKLSGDQRTARDLIKALNEAGPTTTGLQIRAFALLTDVQREWINTEIDRLLEERAEQRGRERYKAELDAKPVSTHAFLNDDGTVNMEALSPALRRQLEPLTEAQRSRRIQRLLSRIGQVRTKDGGKNESPGKAPPKKDQIAVPDPADPDERE